MLLPALVDAADGNDDWTIFVVCSGMIASVSALVATATRAGRPKFSQRLGFLLVTTVWVMTSAVGALPYYFAPIGISYAGAFFETMSGLTTTGSTVISGLDALPPGLLLWRSLTTWIGGVGIIAMVILILPSLRAGGLSLFQMESSDRSDKVLPRVNQLAAGLATAYVALTLACAVTYYMLGMSLFDAVNHSMSTMATAGFSTHDASFGFFESNAILVASTFFMMLASLPFVLYVRAFLPRRFQRWRDPQILVFILIAATLTLILALTRRFINDTPFSEALISSAFNLVSVLSTTGYASEDYTLWSNAAIGVFFIATFLGGCAGSTSGGIKANRLVILFLLMRANFRKLVRPHSIQRLKYGNQDVSPELLQTVIIFVFLYFTSWLFGTMALAVIGLDLLTAMSGALTALSNVGPGFGQIIGPAGNFTSLPDSALWVLSTLMLLGRLEFVTVLILFFPSIWRD